jgi:hypothetical protein
MSEEKDFFTQTYDGLWTLLENNKTWCSYVPVGNRIKFGGNNNRKPIKDEILTADLPEFRIVPISGVYRLMISSSHTRLSKRYQLQAATGDMRTDVYLNQIEIYTVAALLHWIEVLKPMTWKGHQFFTKLEMGEAPEGLSQMNLQRGIKGWSTLMSVTADLYVSTSDLQGVL